MKKLSKCFLFRTDAGEHPVLFWSWNLFFVIASGAGTGFLSLILAYGRYPREVFFGYFRHPLICVLNIVPVVMLVLFLWCLTGRAWIGFLTGSLPVFLASAGNYFKILFRDDPFLFSDVPDIVTALGISRRYNIAIDRKLGFCLACLAVGTVFLALFVRGRPSGRCQLCGAAVLLLAVWPVSRVYVSDSVYNNRTQNYEFIDRWAAPQAYLSRGFVYPFLHSIPAAFPEKPEGYSEAAALEILSRFTLEDIPEDRRVNVIGIQLEAFNDLERLGVEGISPEVYAAYHRLEQESVTGTLLTNIFAGGTVRTERGFLTGDYTLEDFRRNTGCYVWYFKDQGYYTEGCHPYYDYYYNRKNVNNYLGFDKYYFYQDRYQELNKGHIAMDDVLFPDMLTLYQARDPSVPYFHFTVSYQGHGPYPTDSLERGDGYWEGEAAQESTRFILNNYLGSVKETGQRLWDLAEALRSDDAPVVLVAFGDHNPWLGDGNSVYHDLGINLDRSGEDGFRNYYGTRYLIWANDAAKDVLGRDFSGEGPEVSPCLLMNVLFDQCGWGGGSAYLQLMGEVMDRITVMNTDGFFVEDGRFTTELSPEGAELLNRMEIAQYYRKRHPEW